MNTNNVVNVGSKSIKRIIIIAVVILVLLIAGLSCFTVIQPGHTGVVVNLGKVSSTVLEEGLHFKAPFVSQIVQIDNRVMKTEVESNAASKDLQTISSKVSINYRVNKSSSADIYKNVGTDFTNVIVNPAIQECVKSIAAKYTAEQLITNRATVSTEMEDAISQKINPYGLSIEVFNIVNFDFSEEFNKAIEAKQTDKVIMMEFIDKWNGELPKVASDAGALFDVSSYIGATVEAPTDSGNENNQNNE